MHARFSSQRRLAVLAAAGVCAFALVFAAGASAAAPTRPTVTTAPVTAITNSGATLNGAVNPNGDATNVYVQYGPTSLYGSTTATTPLVGGSTNTAVSITLTGLTSGSKYYYRFVATNAVGTTTGVSHDFVTADVPLAITITATPTSVIFGGALVIGGTVTGTKSGNAEIQLQSNPYPYTAGFANIGNPELTFANGTFTFNVIALEVGTEYRVVAGTEASPAINVTVPLAVTLQAQAEGTSSRPLVHFSGTISPAEPSARLAVERFNGTAWVVIGGTAAGFGNGVVAGTLGSTINYGVTLHVHHSGNFRVLVLPVEGGHANGYSPAVAVTIK